MKVDVGGARMTLGILAVTQLDSPDSLSLLEPTHVLLPV